MVLLGFAWGVAAFALMIAAFLPYLSPINWLNLPFSALGALAALAALLRPAGDRAPAIVGFVCSAVALGLAVVRATLGAATF